MDDNDFEWFEHKYPGWYDNTASGGSATPTSRKNGHKPIAFEPDADYEYPHRCWTCMVPCLIREDTVVDEVDGQVRTYCSETCHWTDDVAFRPEYEGRPCWRWASSPANASGRRSTTAWTSPTSCRSSASFATTGRRWSPSRTSTSTRRRCGRWTRSAASRCRARTSSSTRCPPRTARRTSPSTSEAARRRAGRRAEECRELGEKHNVRLEPVGIDFEVDEDETVLHAAFRQGLMLMHGCKEGQCSACKSFLLDGDVDLDRYSTFALPDFEEQEGWTLLCRAHALTDLEVELINYDEDILQGGPPAAEATARVEAIEELTHDIRRLELELIEPERARVPVRASTSTSRSRARTATTARSRSPTCRPTRSRAGVHDQALSRRALLRPARGGRDLVGAPSSTSRGPTGCSPCGTSRPAGSCSSAGARGWRRSCACCARCRSAGSSGRRSTTTARARRPTCSTVEQLEALARSSRPSASSPRCPRPSGTARRD